MRQIPLFPLQIITYPQQTVHLHIFEQRYKAMIEKCLAENLGFGIIPIMQNEVGRIGTGMHIKRINRTYDDGRLDLIAEGEYVFEVNRFIVSDSPEHYHQAIVQMLETTYTTSDGFLEYQVRELYTEFHRLIATKTRLPTLDDNRALSYQIVPFSGLRPEQQLEFLKIRTETNRLHYLKQHFENLNQVVRAAKESEEISRQNGHFKAFPSVDIDKFLDV
jgi:Lon protease-like protein